MEEAIMQICNRVTQFYPGTNVPALIRERVEENRKIKKTNKLKKIEGEKKLLEERERKKIRDEYEADPEAYQNRRKIKALVAKIGK
ncbi:MAG: hypothetical protein CMC15_13300 [Flavobacteriaceae bacterium]|nr:hypothetical protein [Flavobacteriaceae bacterium]